ncbi:MAG: SOS response-associated peptidase [Candidatus Scalindua sp.]|nr:SOS response-associated peptidase [Candidatus Scalindua sp.]
MSNWKRERFFFFAGLYDIWKDGGGAELKTFTIITTEPNMTLKPIHDRMPVILRQECEDAWLGPDSHGQDTDALMAMLRPYPDDDMKACVVSYEVNDPLNDSPQLIREV